MSQAPQDAEEETEKANYLEAFSQLAKKIRNGASFSGRERHCAFLNRGNGSFADVSALSGIGLPDDGRGIALTDWDQDGDVDVWISNRSSPRLRFFQNKIPAKGANWVSFRLVGDPSHQTPRDPVGARVILEMKDGSIRSKTLHAGEGFLSQSSKWLHFGLGQNAEISAIQVHWKGRDYEKFGGLEAMQRWVLKQGTGKALKTPLRNLPVIETEEWPREPETGTARMAWSLPLKIPKLTFQDLSGQERDLSKMAEKKIILLNLWATWCEPCVEELKMLQEQSKQLAQQGIEVVALNVDHLGEANPSTKDPRSFVKEIGFQGTVGSASPKLVELLDQSMTQTFFIHRAMPVPASFLIDRGGWLSMAYKGTFDLKTLLADVQTLGKGPETSRTAAMPYRGLWADREFATNLAKEAGTYIEGQYYGDARHLLEDFLKEKARPPIKATDQKTYAQNMQQAEVYYLLGEIARLENQEKLAIINYEKSLQYHQKQVLVLNRLAWLLATQEDPKIRNAKRAVDLVNFMLQAPAVAQSPEHLGTAAAAYAAAGDFTKAVELTQKVINLLKEKQEPDRLKEQEKRLLLYQSNEFLTE